MNNKTIIEIRNKLAANFGLYYAEDQLKDLERGLNETSAIFEVTPDELVRDLIDRTAFSSYFKKLINILTIGETYFFRDTKLFTFLQDSYLPDLISKKKDKSINIWSAGCSSGEEPYSIAILLERLIPETDSWEINIEATDINSESLDKAATGVYKKWSFRDVPRWVNDGYFTKLDSGDYKIDDNIKKMVSFSYRNILDNSNAANHNRYDLILCRNVMIYFNQNSIRTLRESFSNLLKNDGLLITAPSESVHIHNFGFERIPEAGVAAFKKGDGKRVPELFNDNEVKFTPAAKRSSKIPGKSGDRIIPKSFHDTEKKVAVFSYKDIMNELDKITSESGINEAYRFIKKTIFAGKLNDFSKKEISDLYLSAVIIADKLNDHTNAAKFIDISIKNNKTNARAYYYKSILLQEDGNYAEAKEMLKKTIFLESRFVMAHFTLGNLMMHYESDESVKYLNNALKFLSYYKPGDLVEDSNGLTVTELTELIKSMIDSMA
ncbi:MAG: hypothetical protein K9J16_15390 [Melioribacteraceae bacterium]|nr:hypothetical protein [Melioribacteraceae bacterium]MCF8355080.1 hypothetical protein [Melioribacteraceae bacterium]MCF8395673.1 hypothetical protein [Melioribacteraceae bacterium]MCF8420298.1 hypothetical protein [Melioribacteraceae bacterium]